MKVYNRIRPDFIEPWLSNPKRLLPYTGMPVNFPLDKPLDPKIFEGLHGDLVTNGKSAEQLQAVVDLLLNFDSYAAGQTSIKPLVTQPTPMPGEGENPPAEGASEDSSAGGPDDGGQEDGETDGEDQSEDGT
jgi:hypothetical protein